MFHRMQPAQHHSLPYGLFCGGCLGCFCRRSRWCLGLHIFHFHYALRLFFRVLFRQPIAKPHIQGNQGSKDNDNVSHKVSFNGSQNDCVDTIYTNRPPVILNDILVKLVTLKSAISADKIATYCFAGASSGLVQS